jgi:phenylacetate-CoA ligase
MTLYSTALETLYSLAGKVTPYTAWSIFGEINKAAELSPDELEAVQWQRLCALISFAYENVCLYRDFWGRSGIHPSDIKTRDDFCRLPVLTRAEIESRPPADLLCSGADTRRFASVCSSGTTTGRPLRVFIDNACYNHQYANLLYGYYLSGWRLGTRMMTVRNYSHGDYQGKYTTGDYAREPFEALRALIYRCIHRKQLMPPMQGGMKPDEAHMAAVCTGIKEYAPYLLEGNAYFWYQFAKYALERGERLPSVKGIEIDEICISSGQKKIIAECFQCPVYDCYGSHELGVVAHGCPAQQGNHILSLSHYVEIIDEQTGKKALPGATGSVIITDIVNRGTPLIRYETGDLASMPAKPCSCGRSYPLMSSVAGRQINRIAFGDSRFTEEFFTDRILGFDGAVAFQIDKSRQDALAVSLIARRPDLRDTVEADLRQATGMPVHVALVENIPLEPPGKGRWVRS